MNGDAFQMLKEDVDQLQEAVHQLSVDVAVLKNTWALALKWGAGAGAAVAAIVAVLKEVI